jgi:hypothetical protein
MADATTAPARSPLPDTLRQGTLIHNALRHRTRTQEDP